MSGSGELFLVSVDIETIESPQKGLDWKTITYLGRSGVYIDARNKTVDSVCLFLRKHATTCAIHVNTIALEEISDVLKVLDGGAAKIFVSYAQLQKITADGLLEDFDRLIVSLPEAVYQGDKGTTSKVLRNIVGKADIGVYAPDMRGFEILNTMANKSGPDEFDRRYVHHLPEPGTNIEEYKHKMDRGHIPIIPAAVIAIDTEKSQDMIPLEQLITRSIATDRHDMLYPTVVVNERGICLGLVYSSKESIEEALRTGKGVYKSRKRKGLWVKGETSGDTQELVRIGFDCDGDALQFVVRQKGDGFCHLKTATCFGPYTGLAKLEQTLQDRKMSAPKGSYTARLFSDPKLLQAKILEEANELCEAEAKEHIAAEAADLLYFAMTKCIAAGVRLEDVERDLDRKSMKISRRKGDVKPKFTQRVGLENGISDQKETESSRRKEEIVKEAASVPKCNGDSACIRNGHIQMKRYVASQTDPKTLKSALQRPSQKSTDAIMTTVKPIIENVRQNGDAAVLEYTHKFEKATSLTTAVIKAPFPAHMMQLPPETIAAIDTSFNNIYRFHAAQRESTPLRVETMPGVVCARFARPIERVGLYVPGGTAVLPSTALMLGVPAMVAGCKTIVLASPPRANGTITPEIVYVAHKVGAESIVLAGGAQAVAALAYGTESISKVDKILGPGNQFVTAAKMLVSNDTTACVSMDMPAGPSEVLVIADKSANPAFVASDLLSQAEHGVDSQVVLIAIDLDEAQLKAIEDELHTQAEALPRVDIVRGAIEHSVTLVVRDVEEAMRLSNEYAPEHLILQVEHADKVLEMVEHAGSVFVGEWTPESVGDYSAGVNHSLPTYGYAKQYSGVNLASFTKHITSSQLTREGLRNVGGAVMQLAKVEELEAHRRAVSIRLEHMGKMEKS